MRDFAFTDPDGFKITIGKTHRGPRARDGGRGARERLIVIEGLARFTVFADPGQCSNSSVRPARRSYRR